MKKIFLLLILIPVCSFGQLNSMEGKVTDQNNKGVENASVIVSDLFENILTYKRTDNQGQVELNFDNKNITIVKIEISCLGYVKQEFEYNLVNNSNRKFSIKLQEDNEILKEVIIRTDQKIRINQDTTFLKVSKFTNNTEQTLEDVLKKLPGIKVEADGSIRAHGKIINKLLIDGDDLFDKNYKILSKNLDAKVLDEVQILDNFEENPILKKLSDSDKVALNIKFKEGFTNIWFGSVTGGLGTKNRFKESLNLGLLRKKIKFFYFGDYNNIGEKSTSLIIGNQESIDFSDFMGRIEKRAKGLYSIDSNDNNQFNTSQSLFNKALLNSLSVSTKLTDKIKLRAVAYYLNDIQNQNSLALTEFNIEPNPIFLSENNKYKNSKTLASTELELKYFATEKSYFTNYFSFQNNPEKILNNVLFNENLIDQNLNNKNQSFYNHLQNTFSLTENTILTNYFYFGDSRINQNVIIKSDPLNDFLASNSNQKIRLNTSNQLTYFGFKTSLLIKKNNLESNSTLTIENENERFISNLSNTSNTEFLDNNIPFDKRNINLNQKLKFIVSNRFQITSNFNVAQTKINEQDFILINPNLQFEFSLKRMGRFGFNIDYNSKLPQTNLLLASNQLNSYRSFIKGEQEIRRIYGNTVSLNYSLFNTPKRFSVEASLLYFKTATVYNIASTLNQNINQYNYFIGKGGENTMATIGLTNYFKKLKLATRIETNQNWAVTPIKVNSDAIDIIQNYYATYKVSGTTFFKKFINLDLGYNLNIFESNYKSNTNRTTTSDLYINIDHTFKEIWVTELKYSFYNLDNQNYTFLNTALNYNPVKSPFSYSVVLNNLANEETYSAQSISSFASYKTTIDLVPRYILFSTKYRF